MPTHTFSNHLTHALISDEKYIKDHRPVALAIVQGQLPPGIGFTQAQMIRFKHGMRSARRQSEFEKNCLASARYFKEFRNIVLWHLAETLHNISTYLFRISA